MNLMNLKDDSQYGAQQQGGSVSRLTSRSFPKMIWGGLRNMGRGDGPWDMVGVLDSFDCGDVFARVVQRSSSVWWPCSSAVFIAEYWTGIFGINNFKKDGSIRKYVDFTCMPSKSKDSTQQIQFVLINRWRGTCLTLSLVDLFQHATQDCIEASTSKRQYTFVRRKYFDY